MRRYFLAIAIWTLAWPGLCQAVKVSGRASVSGNATIMSINPNAPGCSTIAWTNGDPQVDFDGGGTTAAFMGEFKLAFATATNICSITFNTTLESGSFFRASI